MSGCDAGGSDHDVVDVSQHGQSESQRWLCIRCGAKFARVYPEGPVAQVEEYVDWRPVASVTR